MKIITMFLITLLVFSCGSQDEVDRIKKLNEDLKVKFHKLETQLKLSLKSKQKFDFIKKQLQNVSATIQTSAGDITVKFYPDKAPLTVYSFILRAESGFYENTKFHRIMPGFMIQGGDPNSRDKNVSDDGLGGPIVNQPHEFNATKHTRGILSVARTPDLSSGAGSQFFIMHGEAPHLDTQYTVFGEVIKGLDIVDKIANAKQRKQPVNYPVKPVTIKRIIVKR